MESVEELSCTARPTSDRTTSQRIHSQQSSVSPHHSAHPSSPACRKGVHALCTEEAVTEHTIYNIAVYSPALCPRNPPSQGGRKAGPGQVTQSEGVSGLHCACVHVLHAYVWCAVCGECMHAHISVWCV